MYALANVIIIIVSQIACNVHILNYVLMELWYRYTNDYIVEYARLLYSI